MRIQGVDHINISTIDPDRCRDFYCQVLGLATGYRPPFESKGHWLYAGDQPIVHISATEQVRNGESALEHIAFAVEGYDETRRNLDAHGQTYRCYDVPATSAKQIFITDPDGVNVELNFRDGT